MSKFLGPIHFWLYKKIQLQEEMTKVIGEKSQTEGWDLEKPLESYFTKERKPLEEVVDQGNIHGWLQEKISEAENRYGNLVSELVKNDIKRLEILEKWMYELGKEKSVEQIGSPQEGYKVFDDYLLNGMPCDRVNMILEQDEEKIVWEQTEDLHGKCWIDKGGDPKWYYDLRTAFLRGLFDRSEYEFVCIDDRNYEIRKKVA